MGRSAPGACAGLRKATALHQATVNTCCTPWITAGWLGTSLTFTMPFAAADSRRSAHHHLEEHGERDGMYWRLPNQTYRNHVVRALRVRALRVRAEPHQPVRRAVAPAVKQRGRLERAEYRCGGRGFNASVLAMISAVRASGAL